VSKATNAKANGELKNLQDAAKDITKHRETAMRDLEAQVKKSQKASAVVREGLSKLSNKRDSLVAELEALKQDLSSLLEQLSICQSGLRRNEGEVEGLANQVSATQRKLL
jgi:chromosome segregation ATPase